MTHDETADDTSATTQAQHSSKLHGPIQKAQGLVESLENDLPPTHTRTVQHLEKDLEVLEEWVTDAEDEGVEALAGAPVVVDTAQLRVDHFQDKIGQTDQDLATRLEEIDDAVEDIEDVVDDLDITTTAYVVYVNRGFAARYFAAEASISALLIAGLDDDIEDRVDEFGLFPQDDLYGDNVEDKAFPANREVDLDAEHRTYWTSTSDGGKIA